MQQYFGLIIFVIMVLAPVIGNVWKKMQEQAEEKAALDRADRRREEMLRTGRAPEPPRASKPQAPRPQSNRPSLEELAAQRQAQLRELRRRQQQGARPQGTPTARQPDRLRPQGARPAPPQQSQQRTPAHIPGMRPQQSGPRQRQSLSPRTGFPAKKTKLDARIAAAQQRQQREAHRQEQLKREAEYRARQDATAERHRKHVEADDAKMDAALRLPSEQLKQSMRINAADLRRIVLQAEIIGKPLALRDSLDDRVL